MISLNSESCTYSFQVQLHPYFLFDLVKFKLLSSRWCKLNLSAAQEAASATRFAEPRLVPPVAAPRRTRRSCPTAEPPGPGPRPALKRGSAGEPRCCGRAGAMVGAVSTPRRGWKAGARRRGKNRGAPGSSVAVAVGAADSAGRGLPSGAGGLRFRCARRLPEGRGPPGGQRAERAGAGAGAGAGVGVASGRRRPRRALSPAMSPNYMRSFSEGCVSNAKPEPGARDSAPKPRGGRVPHPPGTEQRCRLPPARTAQQQGCAGGKRACLGATNDPLGKLEFNLQEQVPLGLMMAQAVLLLPSPDIM